MGCFESQRRRYSHAQWRSLHSAEGWVSLKQGEQHTTRFESSKWHNGVAIFVISKKKAIMEGTADFVQVAKVSEIPKEDLEQFKHMMKRRIAD